MKLAQRIRACRQRRGLSQEVLAERMQVSRQAVTKWEAGKACPSTEKLLRLSQVLEVPLEELTGPEPAPRRNPLGGRLPWGLLGVTLLLGICTIAALLAGHPAPEGAIGYADAPTGIYVTGAPVLPGLLGLLTAGMALATLAAFLFSRRGGRK